MKTFIISSTTFVVGGLFGLALGLNIQKKKARKKADEEVESVKQSLQKYYDEKINNYVESQKNISAKEEKIEITKKSKNSKKSSIKKSDILDSDSINYDKLKEERDIKKYVDISKSYKEGIEVKEETPVVDNVEKPYVLSPEEFADSEYDVQTLVYYSDGVLADDQYNVIKDIKGYVGDKALKNFGVYEEDVVYVRNEKYKIDYEILLDERAFSQVAPRGGTNVFPGDDE